MKTTKTKNPKNLMLRNGVWTFRIKRTVDGVTREKWISTGTTAKAAAVVEAGRLREEINKAKRDGKWEELGRLNWRDGAPSIAELEARYRERIAREAERPPQGRAIDAYWRNLRSVIAGARTAVPSGEERRAAGAVSSSSLTAEAVKSFRVQWMSGLAEGDVDGEASRRRSGDSMLRQARACFSAEALRCYAGMGLPDLSGWLKAAGFASRAPEHSHITLETLGAMDAAAREFRESNPRLYVAHLLFKFCGLRTKEVQAVKVGWFRRLVYGGGRPDQWVLEISGRCGYVPKWFSTGQVPVKTEVMRELVAGWRALGLELLDNYDSPEDMAGCPLCIPAADETARYDVVYREHSKFMRRFLPIEDFTDSSYEMRRWGQQRMAGRFPLSPAGLAFIRHKAALGDKSAQAYGTTFYNWSALGDDVGISLEEARGGYTSGATAQVRTGFAGL